MNKIETINWVDHLIYCVIHYDNGGSKRNTLTFISGMLEVAQKLNDKVMIEILKEKTKYISSLDDF